jgi:hypothetical protein
MPDTHTASCNCGAIRIEARGQPVRVGLCHCTTCRKGGGAPFTANAIWRAEDVTIQGNTRSWKDTTVSRYFCPTCGSSLFAVSGGTAEIAIGLGAFDQAPYSFGWEGSEVVPPGSSLIEIDLIDRDGGTLLRITHSGLPDAEQCASHDWGWAHYLGRLAIAATGQNPGVDHGPHA